MIQQTRVFKNKIVWSLIICMLLETVVFPTAALALTEGPKQPEFEKFTPIATTNMVNTFTGDFQYNLPVLNIPGADGGGYALSLAYDANPSMGSEASWVGQNWTLNPGALSRSKNGLPDDYQGKVKEFNNVIPSYSFSRTDGFNQTLNVGSGNASGFGLLSYNVTNSWNNSSGYGTNHSIGSPIFSNNSTGTLNISGRDITLGVNFSLASPLSVANFAKKALSILNSTESQSGWGNKSLVNNILKTLELRSSASTSGNFGLFGHIVGSVASGVKPHRKMSYTFGGAFQLLGGPITFSYSRVQNSELLAFEPNLTYDAYGYMYNPSWEKHKDHKNNSTSLTPTGPSHIMSDYGIEKNTNYSYRDNVIGIVHNNADYFNAIGEGISGSYRLHHNKVGHFYSDFLARGKSRNVSEVPNLSGGGGLISNVSSSGIDIGVGVTITPTFQFENRTSTESRMWLIKTDEDGLETNASDKEYPFDYESLDAHGRYENLPFFRAKNDLGGGLLYVSPDELDELVNEYRGGFFGKIKDSNENLIDGAENSNRPNISRFINDERHKGQDYYKGQSSHMEYVRNKDLGCIGCATSPFRAIDRSKAFDKHESVLKYIDDPDPTLMNGPTVVNGVLKGNSTAAHNKLYEHIAQIRVWNPNGMKYTYGLPVYVRNEANFTYGVDIRRQYARYGCGTSDFNKIKPKKYHNDICYPAVDGDYNSLGEAGMEVKQGQELREWYASTYLMTQITTPDYVDLTGNGATDDDFGGYTRFDYRRWHKEDNQGPDELNNWYRFRSPYTGLKYSPGELTKKGDDIGSVSHGYREVYYLNAIETKSHVALFITNKTDASQDFSEWSIPNIDDYNGTKTVRFDGLGQVEETQCERPKGMDGIGDIVVNSGKNYQSQNHGGTIEKNEQAINAENAKDLLQDVEKLERVVLFSKDDLTKPLVTTHFEYDYSSWENVSNNIFSNYKLPKGSINSGKLTLKKMWFEYEGVKRHTVNPYEFEYTYAKPDNLDPANGTVFKSEVKNRYPELFANWPSFTAEAEEPDYNQHAMNRWGHLGYNPLVAGQKYTFAEKRRQDYKHWVYQGDYSTTGDEYDPAAWMLKKIKLPSGGEIHVQYEEKTYQKVQDKNALAMVSLIDGLSQDDTHIGGTGGVEPRNIYYLNLTDMGIDGDVEKEKELVKKIRSQYMRQGDSEVTTLGDPNVDDHFIYTAVNKPGSQENKIHFKFLYQLEEGNAESNEYISSYALVREVGRNANGVYLSLGDPTHEPWFAERKGIPRSICYDHVQYRNHGHYGYPAYFEYQPVWHLTTPFSSHYNDFKNEVDGTGNPVNFWGNFVDEDGIGHMEANFKAKEYPHYVYGDACKSINYSSSYIRVPMVTPKRGGGVRVKRVLMYDEGIFNENGDAQLFGLEYDYVKEDGTCSGVATNEPSEGREENALVEYEKRVNEDPFLQTFAGTDKSEGETPYGEFLLPPPMVNYSRVVVSNIYKGKQQNKGFSVREYFTTEDYPNKMKFKDGILSGKSSVRHTNLGSGKPTSDDKLLNYKRTSLVPLNLGLFNYNQSYRWLNQTFMFIQTNMNGQMKSEQTYGGVYSRDYFIDPIANANLGISLTSRVTYDYIQPGEKAKMLSYDRTDNRYYLEHHHLGVEDDITMTAQAVYKESTRATMDLGFVLGYLNGALGLSASVGLGFSFGEEGTARHMTTRVLYFPAVLKSVTTEKDGAKSKVEYLAFSDLTGGPILTKTTDGYDRSVVVDNLGQRIIHDGSIYNWNLPAAWFYKDMGKKSIKPDDPTTNPNNGTNQLTASVGSVTSYGVDGNPLAGTSLDDWATNPKNVLSATAMTLKQNWFDDGTISGAEDPIIKEYVPSATSSEITNYAMALNKQFRVDKTFVYNPRETASSANENQARTVPWGENGRNTFNSGVNDAFTMFDWITPANNTSWIGTTEVTKYSPNGNSLEELNLIANIPSAAKYGYDNFLNTAIAKNAQYNSIGFESFEDGKFSISMGLEEGAGHAGEDAFKLSAGYSTIIGNLNVSNRVQDDKLGNGLMVRLWARNDLAGRTPIIDFAAANTIDVRLNGTPVVASSSSKVIAQVGNWVLLEYRFDVGDLQTASGPYELQIRDLTNTPVIDDVRIQPVNSEMATHVYDSKTFKLLATFGSEHFGSFYQYNDEGGLIRTLIETERGIKTIQENQRHTPRFYTPSR